MKFICSKTDLLEGIILVQNAIPTKAVTSFLEGILIEAGENLKFTGFNLEIGIECFVNAQIIEKGSLVLNSKLFGDIVKALPDTEVSVEAGSNCEVCIEAEGSRFEIKGIPADGYPVLPEVEKGVKFSLPQNILKDMIKKTSFAVGVDQHRIILTGSLIECNGKEVNVVAIDGFRVAWRKEYIEKENSEMKVIIPGKAISELARILFAVNEDIEAEMSVKNISFKTNRIKFISRILEGEYLAYRSLIPSGFSTIVRINPLRMAESVERACLLAGEEKNTHILLSVKKGKLLLTATSYSGSNKEEMNIDQDGGDLEIYFNPRFLLDIFKAVQDESTVQMKFNSNVHPCVIVPDKGDKFTYIVLPLRV